MWAKNHFSLLQGVVHTHTFNQGQFAVVKPIGVLPGISILETPRFMASLLRNGTPPEGVPPMRIPWLHGEAPGDSLSRSLICPLLQDEDPALIQGPSPKLWGTPAGNYQLRDGLHLTGGRRSAVPTCGDGIPTMVRKRFVLGGEPEPMLT